MLVHLLQVINILIHLFLLLQTQLRLLVAVGMLVLQLQFSKTTKDLYLLLVLFQIEHLRFKQEQVLSHTLIKVVVMHMSFLQIIPLARDIEVAL